MNRNLAALVLGVTLAAGIGTAVAQEDTGLYERPVLVLEPGMHTALIWRADVDASGTYAVTGSEDRTVRIWSVASGALLRTIRVPHGPGNVGKVNAVAISPDGDLVAAGGWTRFRDVDQQEQIYLFDRATGALMRRLDGLPSNVLHLVFSSNGRYLATALSGTNGLRVFDREANWHEVARDTDYGGPSYGAAFSTDSRLATTSYDGHVRLYDGDFKPVKMLSTPAGSRPFGVAFNPAGDRLAVGFSDSTAVSLFDGHDLSLLTGADTWGIDNGDLATVAWSVDGEVLYAGGEYNRGVVAWSDTGTGSPRALSAGVNTVMSVKPLPGGRILVASADPYLGVLNADGTPRWQLGPPKMDLRGQRHSLAVSPDGSVVDFGYEVSGDVPARFDLSSLALTLNPADDERATAPEQYTIEVGHWANSYRPTLNGEPLHLHRSEISRSLAIHPDGARFVLGTEWFLRAFEAEGEELWRRSVPSVAWAVNITADGRLVVAAYGDGTIRWHRMDNGKELLAFMPLADRRRWVVWTPEGYYAQSPGTADVLGWHVNRGWDEPAEFFPVSAITGFYQPAVLRLVLQEMETSRALGIAKIARDRKNVQQAVDSPAPPGAQLHVLTVGISEYGRYEHLTLDFADDDARDVANALLAQEGLLYARVNTQHLTDGDATRQAILRALGTIHHHMQPDQDDVAVIHFSGHGAVVNGVYYLLPHDVEVDDEFAIESTGIEIDRLNRVLRRLGERGKVLVLLDTSHSGNVMTSTKNALPPDIETVREALAAAGNGVIVLTSSTGKEVSRENPDWENGAFTEAVLEALRGDADSDGDQWVSVTELEGYVVKRVRKMTDNRQNPRIMVIGEHHYQAPLFFAGG